MTAYDAIRAAIPGAPDDLCSHIVWGRTPFPFKRLEARDFYRAASRFQRAHANGRVLCDMCDRIAVEGKCMCTTCQEGLEAIAS